MRKFIALSLLSSSLAVAQTPPVLPDRQLPPTVLAELRLLSNRFASALYQDCAPERCFDKGCVYGEHHVADRPRSTALPGLAETAGPGAVAPQEYLTLARCTFAHERSLSARHARALTKRLQTKLSNSWTQVVVDAERLDPIPASLRNPPEPPKPPEPDPPKPEPDPTSTTNVEPDRWQPIVALRELWVSMLPHFSWMVAVVMVTLAALLLIWGWRRLGRLSPEEQVMLSQLSQAPLEVPDLVNEEPAQEVEVVSDVEIAARDEDFIAEQKTYWAERLSESSDPHEPDPDVRALIADWLRTGEMGLLAKAVLTYPKVLPSAFPGGGEFAEPKHRFSEYLKDVDETELPSELNFYQRLKQHALSASLGRQPDARGMASLHADFGAAGLVHLISALPARAGALVFAHSSLPDKLEASRQLADRQTVDLSEQLLRSNRMSPPEAEYLVQLLSAVKNGDSLPAPPKSAEVSDHGSIFDAASALSVLMPMIEPGAQKTLLATARDRFGGVFPAWYQEILWPDVLLKLGVQERAGLFFELDVKDLAGWLSLLPPASENALLAGTSETLRSAVQASADFASHHEHIERYQRGRRDLAAALHRHLARASVSFESLVS